MTARHSILRLGNPSLILGGVCLVWACGGQATYSSDDDSDGSGTGGADTDVAVGTGGTSSPEDGQGTGGASLNFNLSQLSGKYAFVAEDTPSTPIPWADFHFREDQIIWDVGCNDHFGTYTIADGMLVIDSFGKSQADCGREIGNREDFMYTFLVSRPNIFQAGENIIITSSTFTLVLVPEDDSLPR